MHDTLVVRVNADKTIPDDVIAKIIKEYPSCMGIAMCTSDTDGTSKLEVETFSQPPDAEGLKNLLETYKAATLYMSFGDFPGEFVAEDVQPFTVVSGEEDGNPLMVMFGTGEFTGFEKPESNRSSAYHAFDDFVKPYVQKMITDAGQDMPFKEFMGLFNDKLNKQALLGTSIGRVTLLFLAADGSEAWVSKNQEEGEYPWGYLSSRMDIPVAMGKPAEEKKEHTSKGSFFAAMRKKETPKQDEAKPPASTKTTNGAEETQFWSPSANIKSNNELRTEYTRVAGFLPPNYKERPPVPVAVSRLKRFQQLASPEAAAALAAKKAELESKAKDTAPHHLPVSVKDMPLIPAEAKEALKSFMAGLPTIDEKKLTEMEGLTPTFEQSTGFSLDKMEDIPFSKFLELAGTKAHQNSIAVLAYNLVRDRKKLRAYIAELEEKATAPDKGADEDVADTSGTGTVKEEPKGKGSFFAAMRAKKSA